MSHGYCMIEDSKVIFSVILQEIWLFSVFSKELYSSQCGENLDLYLGNKTIQANLYDQTKKRKLEIPIKHFRFWGQHVWCALG